VIHFLKSKAINQEGTLTRNKSKSVMHAEFI